MRRGAKPARAKVETRRPVGRKSPKNEASKRRELEKRLAEGLEREKAIGEILQEKNRALTEALGQQTATAEILRIIGRSPTDLQPVFDAIVESAARLCDARFTALYRYDGELVHVAAHHNLTPEVLAVLQRLYPMRPAHEQASGRAIMGAAVVHLPNVLADPEYRHEVAIAGGWASLLAVPMMREGRAVGTINIYRGQAEPFPENQIELLKTFADQAVIAIENVRLFTELEERNRQVTRSLEHQTATADILRVISQSPTNVQPVFDTIADSSMRLCEASVGVVLTFDGKLVYLAGMANVEPAAANVLQSLFPMPPSPRSAGARAIWTQTVIIIPDVFEDPHYGIAREAEAGGFRSVVAVPMLRDGKAIGAVTAGRPMPGPFTDSQVALLRTFADQAVIAIENVRLFNELEGRNRDLTATSEILRVISSSPTDVQPVLDAVAQSAARLCETENVSVYLVEGPVMRRVAGHGPVHPAAIGETRPITLGSASGRAIVERRVVQIEDLAAARESEFPDIWPAALAQGIRTTLAVPLLREGTPVGAITVYRVEARPFTPAHIGLLQTFADQALIAIENVRLFTELESRNSDLRVALEQQTATSEILRVISSSQTDVQPVFETIARSVVQLCEGLYTYLSLFDGAMVRFVAYHNVSPEALAILGQRFPSPATRGSSTGRAILNRAVVHIPDVSTDTEYEFSDLARADNYQAILAVPMLREGAPIGAITVSRRAPFSENQIELVKTFADQAVIAIENVRLFNELEGRNRDLTATSEILRVISSSPTDVQPVFDTIVRSAVRLCDGLFSGLLQFDGELIHFVAHHNHTPEALEELHRIYPARPTRALLPGRAILDRAVVHIPDIDLDPEFQYQALSRAIGFRSGLWVPMLREGTPIGVIVVARAEPGPFSDNEIELLKTFADQAVIAIENVRLFKELQARTAELTQSVEKLTALGEVSQALSSTLDVETVLNTIVSHASQLADAAGCSIYEYDEAAEQFELRATHNYDARFVEALRAAPIRKGEGLMGRAAEMREPMQVPDIAQPGAYQSSVRDTLIRFGYRAILSVPLLREEQIIGSLTLTRKAPGEFSPEVIDVLKTFATQSALAIQNARLFREIADKSRQLEVASRHKSEFLANMSHELRTPLNAIIGFSEVLVDRMFGELNAKQDEYLKDIYASGQHLLSLINDILDLSKIEAGRMELEVTDFDLPSAIDNALTLVRERATRRGITLGRTIDEHLGMLRGDERKVKQVLLNLLSNALKFTPEGGRIDVRAGVHGDVAEVSVADTGVGIAPEDQEAVFEEFRQVGTADKKVEGTGLGLALSRKFIELHGGRIWVESQVGQGSTFTFTLPVRRGE